MTRLAPEQLLVLAVFLLVPLLNLLLRWFRKRMQDPRARPLEPPAGESPPPTPRPRAVHLPRTGGPRERPRREILQVRAQPPALRRVPRVRLRGRRELRRGFVLMAILGPCRGLEGRQPPLHASDRPGAEPRAER